MLDGIVPPLIVLVAAAALLILRHVYARSHGRASRSGVTVTIGLVVLVAVLELSMGRPLAYRNGPVRLWVGDVNSDQNSQQILDPYSFTHVVHGALFYGLTRGVMWPAALATRVVVAIALESAWEVYENTDTVISRYRTATIALGYYGDSVTNSIADILACLVGFVLAITIRDNLTLNIIMLIRPIEAIRRWQVGG